MLEMITVVTLVVPDELEESSLAPGMGNGNTGALGNGRSVMLSKKSVSDCLLVVRVASSEIRGVEGVVEVSDVVIVAFENCRLTCRGK